MPRNQRVLMFRSQGDEHWSRQSVLVMVVLEVDQVEAFSLPWGGKGSTRKQRSGPIAEHMLMLHQRHRQFTPSFLTGFEHGLAPMTLC